VLIILIKINVDNTNATGGCSGQREKKEMAPMTMTDAAVPRGLKGVIVADTALGDVRGLEGFYHYRQYSAPELAELRTFDDVWYLLFEGELPSAATRQRFVAEIAEARDLPPLLRTLLPAIAGGTTPPLGALRTALSLLAAAEAMPPTYDAPPETVRANALRICAVTPVLVAALYRASIGLEPIAPRPDLTTAANYLYMIDGDVPDPARARALEQYLILGIDHGFNASTFTARVVTSTGADVGAAVVAALGALSGPLHGGAPSRALDTLDAIGSPDNTEAWVRHAVAHGERIMGFGHAVYRTADPRSVMLREVARSFGGPRVEFAEQVEATVERVLAELKPGRELHTNVEYYAGVVMELCGIPRPLFTPTFAASRTVGWCAQILEQSSDSAIIRPSARYVGPAAPVPVPVAS
jgi:citrate synthase